MRNYIATTLLENFQISFRIAAGISFIPTLIFPNLNLWFNDNIDYLSFAFVAIAIDHVLGSFVHSSRYMNDFDFKKNISGFFIKVSMVIAFGIMMEGLAHITIADDFIYKYIRMSGRILVIIYPTLSAMKNMQIITGGKFPPEAIIGKMEKFNKTLDINEFRDKENNEPQQF